MKNQWRWHTHWYDNSLMCVIEEKWKIIGFAREAIFTKNKVSWIWNVWIDKKYRWEKLWLKLVKYLVKKISKNIIYLDCEPSLCKYYKKIWFIQLDIKNYPKDYLDKEEMKKFVIMELNKERIDIIENEKDIIKWKSIKSNNYNKLINFLDN